MNNTTKLPQKSSNSLNATGLTDRKIASPIEALLSKIKANFGKTSQDKPNFAARVGLGAAQKPQYSLKTTATKGRHGFTLFM